MSLFECADFISLSLQCVTEDFEEGPTPRAKDLRSLMCCCKPRKHGGIDDHGFVSNSASDRETQMLVAGLGPHPFSSAPNNCHPAFGSALPRPQLWRIDRTGQPVGHTWPRLGQDGDVAS